MNIVIGIPTINRTELLHRSLNDISRNFANKLYKLIIVDNGNQLINLPRNLPIDSIHRQDKNLGCGGSWNYIMDTALQDRNVDHVIMACDDIVMGRGIYDNLEELYRKYPDYYVIAGRSGLGRTPEVTDVTWALITISRKCWEEIGKFDEQFWPAYFEDSDYAYRLKLAGKEVIDDDLFTMEKFQWGQSVKKDPSLMRCGILEQQYIKKWGGTSLKEIYTTPYNGES